MNMCSRRERGREAEVRFPTKYVGFCALLYTKMQYNMEKDEKKKNQKPLECMTKLHTVNITDFAFSSPDLLAGAA